MKIETLVSTMNKKEMDTLVNDMNLKEDFVIINQIPDENVTLPDTVSEENKKFLSYHDKGLSKSRNLAIKNSNADICVIADDDMYYEDDYKEKIEKAYEKHKDADIIAFVVEHEGEKQKKIMKEQRIHLIKSMKISSVQITFKRKSILKKNICFKEEFGAGAKYNFGEENIFLSECLRQGLKIYYEPVKIATLIESESTWSRENTEEHFNIAGAVYYEMSKKMYPVFIVQFVIRKKKIYAKDLKPKQVLKYMFDGAKKYKKL